MDQLKFNRISSFLHFIILPGSNKNTKIVRKTRHIRYGVLSVQSCSTQLFSLIKQFNCSPFALKINHYNVSLTVIS